MKRKLILAIVVGLALPILSLDVWARGGGRGGGGRAGGMGGGGMGGARMGGGGFSPSMSRPSMPASRPNVGGGLPGGSRPAARPPAGGGGVGANRPSPRPTPGGVRPGAAGTGVVGGRPSAGQLNEFLNVPRPGTGGGTTRIGNLPREGGAASDFLRGETASQRRPESRPAPGNVFGDGAREGLANRPGLENRPAFQNRPTTLPGRIENRDQWMNNRSERWDQVRDQVRDNYPRLDFWADHPNWARWRINTPYRWAAWGAVTGWLGYGAMTATPYSYGDTIYYQDDSVYNAQGEQVATADEYSQQAEQIATSAPDTPPEQSDWMPLGVFALTQDGEASGAPPSMFMQLAVNKDGVLNGLLNNKLTGETQELEGAIDKDSQRAAWTVKGQSRPIIETGLSNLTSDTGPALIHFADETTQQVLLVRLPDPDAPSQGP